jgi:hypothetical protein
MAFGTLSSSTTIDPGAVSGAQFLLNLANLLVDREATVAQLRELAEEAKRVEGALAELKKREQQVLHREREATKHEEALAKREADVTEREQQAQFQLQRAEEQRAEIAALKADLRQAWAA